MSEKVAKELVKAREAVKRKYRALKSDIAESQIRQSRELKPITEPLQELIKTIKTEQLIKREPSTSKQYSTPSPKIERRETNIYNKYPMFEYPSFLRDEATFQTDEDVFYNDLSHQATLKEPTTEELRQQILETTQEPAYQDYLSLFGPLVREYVDSSFKTDRDLDNTHGLTHDVETEKWKIGNSQVDFEGDNIKIGNVMYKGTPGLYELLFFQDPRGYSNKDLGEYMDILKRTNAYRRNYNPEDQIQGTTDPKYLTIIKPFLIEKKILKPGKSPTKSVSSISKVASALKPAKSPSKSLSSASQVAYALRRPITRQTSKKGGTLLNLSNKKVDYVYFDDINELVNRLKLLVASQNAGHTGHSNEIVSILEELREAEIIE